MHLKQWLSIRTVSKFSFAKNMHQSDQIVGHVEISVCAGRVR